jgi:hypothetical protein
VLFVGCGIGQMAAVPAENSQCAQLRDAIARDEQEVRMLRQSLVGLDPRNPADRLEIRQIQQQITALRQAIVAAQGQMATLACPATPNPGGQQLVWSLVGNTAGFGHAINDGRPFWTGDFTGDGKTDILFHFHGDVNWWLGSMNGANLTWTLVANW